MHHGEIFGIWETPKRWAPLLTRASRKINLRERILRYLPDQQRDLIELGGNSDLVMLIDDGVLAVTRLMILCRLGPAKLGRIGKGRSLDPSTLTRMGLIEFPQLLAIGLSKRIAALIEGKPGVSGFFRNIVFSDIVSTTDKEERKMENEISRLWLLRDHGLWRDVPDIAADLVIVTGVYGKKGKRDKAITSDPHTPLPDDYVAEMGRNCLWLIKELGPTLINVAKDIRSIWLVPDDLTVSAVTTSQRRDRTVRKFLKMESWRNSNWKKIRPPPFDLRQTKTGKHSHINRGGISEQPTVSIDDAWKPKTFVQFVLLCKLLQNAHIFVVGLSMGARKSEIVTLKRDCLVKAKNGMSYANGRTWKLLDNHEGEVRDWVLPELAMQAIEQQVELVTLMDDIGSSIPNREYKSKKMLVPNHLWAEIGAGGTSDRTKPLLFASESLYSCAKFMGMDSNPGGQPLKMHRLRKTVARLAALALTQAPKILKDVFGHESIEMTLYYILADKDLQVDVERVSRELRVMRAKDTIEAIVESENLKSPPFAGIGGPAVLMVEKSIKAHQSLSHRRGEQWGAESAMELAEILTLQGKTWDYVRPGIICTKFPGTESGPCNQSKGAAEPARCQSHCKHRLEEAFLREDVDKSIDAAISAFKESTNRGDDLIASLWADQVRLHLDRFKDLRKKWLQNPDVRALIKGESVINDLVVA
ncbi:UNVERIFIED_ORG: hypothetical protein HNP28_003221 [Comamonas terrigena]